MALSNDVISQFAKLANSNKTEQKETVVYGTIVISDGKKYVRLDGSNMDTPVSSTTSAKDGDRVMVTIKNHEAIVTGNITRPSADQDSVDDIGDKTDDLSSQVSEFGVIVSYKITTEDIDAINAHFDTMKAISGKFEELEAVTAEIEELQVKFADIEYINAEEAKILNAEIDNLKVKIGEFSGITTEDLEAFDAEIVNLTARVGNFTYVSTEVLEAVKADIEELNVKKLDAESAEIKYANIDFANISEAAVVKIFSESGIIKDLVVDEGTITGELVGVTIKGDLIEGNTVKADKLVVKGSDGLYYKLNFEGGTFADGEVVPDDGLHGSVIVANSITAEKINVKDLVAFGATIGGFNINTNSIYSGVKESATNTTRGVFFGNDGQFAVGDSTNFFKYYKDRNGNYKLEVSAASIKIGGSNTNIVQEIEDVKSSIDNLIVGGRNMIKTSDPVAVRSGYEDCIYFDEEGYLHIDYNKIPDGRYRRAFFDFNVYAASWEINTEFTLSFDCYNAFSSEESYMNINCAMEPPLKLVDGRNKYTFTPWDLVYQTMPAYIEIPEPIVDGYSLLSNFKLERGNVATDWTPAPEDVEDSIYKAINDLEIGAINLLTGTKDMSGFYAYPDATTFDTYDNNFTHAHFQEVTTSSFKGISSIYSMINAENIYDREVTLSFEVRSDQAEELNNNNGSISVGFVLCPANTVESLRRTDISLCEPYSTDWTRYSITCKLTKEAFNNGDGSFDDAARFYIEIYDYSLYSMDIRKVKLEYGNVATDWCETNADIYDKINDTQDSVNEVIQRLTTTELNIDTLKKQISALVSDENGYSLMTQTSTGWVLNMGDVYSTLDTTNELLNNTKVKVDEVNKLSSELNTAISGISDKTSYLTIGRDDEGKPCIELGQNESDFKVRITNTAVEFMEGTKPVAWVSNKSLYIEKAIIKQELHIGEGTGFVFAKRANGNMGIRWKESD